MLLSLAVAAAVTHITAVVEVLVVTGQTL